MAKIQSTEVVQRAVQTLRLNPNVDKIPNESEDKIQTIVDVTYPDNKILNFTVTAGTGTPVLLTTNANKDTYITGVQYHFAKDATNDMATGATVGIGVVVDGSTRAITAVGVLTLTAQSVVVNQTFNPPIKLDRNTNISDNGASFTVGLLVRTVSIFGYELSKF